MANFEPNSAKELINRFINSIGARDETGVVPFVQAWSRLVGTDRAAHSQVLDVKNGTVLIGVDHPAWLQQMHIDRVRIVARIQRDFPSLNVRTLAFTVVSEFQSPWSGDTGESGDNEATGHAEQPTEPSVRAVEEDVEVSESTEARAEDDEDFQRHLDGLRRALEQKERDADKERSSDEDTTPKNG